MKKTKRLLITVLMTAAPAVVFAQADPQGMTYEQFNHIDKDDSGTISRIEYYQFMEGAFKELDTDKNNSLSQNETAHILTAEQFSKLDANGNGRVNRQEFLDHVMENFDRHDSDNDGELRP